MTWDEMQQLMWPATGETMQMVGVATVVTILLGLPLGLLLVLTDQGGALRNRPVNRVVGGVVNVGRSLPFVILMVALQTFTRAVVGTTIGWQAATVPLAIGAIPFFARLVETAVREIDRGLLEAVQAMGGSTWTAIRKVMLPESLPALVSSVTTTVVALIGFSAMAGTVGGGGLGTLAVNYGYQRFETTFMWVIVAELVVIVMAVQLTGDLIVRRLTDRGRTGGTLRLLPGRRTPRTSRRTPQTN